MVQIVVNSLLTVLAAVGMASCHTVKGDAPRGKVFDHILQVWFENQVHTLS
jgi:hypothetical protein